ncbi:GspH/FimT family protein [uncultured Ferrimonas sp.]|uniref:GspH/FimT family pseudopilin n=1 Tax=uncultured Ferrimonas sp. TaxID=432640 RepID=UPI00260D901C|nr:GspH/FimT family protein [uncultured Ferrimonas sp.]
MRKRNQGMTLVELMITLIIAAVLIAIAVPSLHTLTMSSRSRSATDGLYQDLMMARQLAATYQNSVTVCHLSSNSCDGDWSKGYTVFIDADGSNSFTLGDETVQTRRPLNDADKLIYAANQVRFNGDGSSINNGDFVYCPNDANSEYSRSIRLSSSGMLRSLGVSGNCS